MGIKGTVRRSTDGHVIHANIDTDIIIAEEPTDGILFLRILISYDLVISLNFYLAYMLYIHLLNCFVARAVISTTRCRFTKLAQFFFCFYAIITEFRL
jgi:hypothetical protein